MHTLIKTTLAAASALAAASLTVPATAGDEPILVQPTAAMEDWTETTERALDKRLIDAVWLSRINPTSGIVQLRFSLNDDGRANDIEVYRSSGQRRTDRVAMRAVRSLANLDEVPVDNPRAQTFQANIIFANTLQEHQALTEELAKVEAKRLARGESERSVVSLGG